MERLLVVVKELQEINAHRKGDPQDATLSLFGRFVSASHSSDRRMSDLLVRTQVLPDLLVRSVFV